MSAGKSFVRLEPLNIQRVTQMLEQAPAIAQQELLAAMTWADLLLQREVAERTPTAHGTLRASIFSEERIQGDGVLGVVASPLAYAEYVELGTRPHFPPLEPLEDWVKTKFGLAGDEARGVAFAVALSIAARGTPAVRMFTRAFEENSAQIERRFELGVQRIEARMREAGAD